MAEPRPAPAYLDGRELYGEADHAELPQPDALHPDAPPTGASGSASPPRPSAPTARSPRTPADG